MYTTNCMDSETTSPVESQNSIVKENELDMREEENGSFNRNTHQTSYTGYIDNRFDVRSSGKQSGYVVPIQQTGGSGSLI